MTLQKESQPRVKEVEFEDCVCVCVCKLCSCWFRLHADHVESGVPISHHV